MEKQRQHKKVLLHVECLQGVGEITQAVSLASQLLKKGAEVEVVTSSGFEKFSDFKGDLNEDDKARLTLHKLPAIELQDNKQETLDARRVNVLEYAEKADRIILASGWPHWLGDGILDDEMFALTDYAKTKNIPTSLLTREVMEGDSPQIYGGDEAIAELFEENENLTWLVLGDKNIIPLGEEYSSINPRQIKHMGYGADTRISSASNAPTVRKAPDKVIVTSGGGDLTHTEASYHLLRAAMVAAQNGAFPDAEWTVIVGKDYDDDKKQALHALAKELPNVEVVETLPYDEFQATLKGNSVLIGELGIGVANDIIKNRTRAIIIPKATDITTTLPDGTEHIANFTEQETRSKAFRDKRLIRAVIPKEEGLDVNSPTFNQHDKLAAAISHEAEHVYDIDTKDFETIQTNGFQNAAEGILSNFKTPLQHPPSPHNR